MLRLLWDGIMLFVNLGENGNKQKYFLGYIATKVLDYIYTYDIGD